MKLGLALAGMSIARRCFVHQCSFAKCVVRAWLSRLPNVRIDRTRTTCQGARRLVPDAHTTSTPATAKAAAGKRQRAPLGHD
jgi:hypothetical protein